MAVSKHESEARSDAIWAGNRTRGRNGVEVAPRTVTNGAGYRSYEIYQRQRVHQSTEKLNPSALISHGFLLDPYPALTILRENYPCYRDWVGNSYWVTRYDDVTSVFVDDANFETRPKRWFYGLEDFGRDLQAEGAVTATYTVEMDRHAANVAEQLLRDMASNGEADIAIDFAARYPIALLAKTLNIPSGDFDFFATRYWLMQSGYGWDPLAREAGLASIKELTSYLSTLLEQRKTAPGEDLISTFGRLALEEPASAEDIVATLLEMDHETLHGSLANLWFLLLTHPDQLALVDRDRRLVKFAYLEALRHSAPVLTARRFARHEVERFGQLLPEGALVYCAAAAGNRDPRIFDEPDRFNVVRKDICQREPRGQYRADGLPAGIALGFGKPSKLPALPDNGPRSHYALGRDITVLATNLMLDALKNIRLKPGTEPTLRCQRTGGMHTCWQLLVTFDRNINPF